MTRFSQSAILLLALCLGACAWMKDNPQTAKLIIQVATMKVIEGGGDKVTRAQRVSVIVGDAKSLLGGEQLSLPALRQAITFRLANEDLTPSDQLLADALVDAVDAELQKRIGEGLLNPEQVIQVKDVLDWITEAAQVYIPPHPGA